ncbi:Folliculin-interacting protein 2 [Chionoecetes opilio]|uniref:Folliculin-interacting protein 2 n=1 Tax=Chionoecetes opilio TaxID=41210 RepID=A0A8J5CMV6_CHIOP|nr:Folliculin-interacting protein 2 [Chionoecetes opilio]
MLFKGGWSGGGGGVAQTSHQGSSGVPSTSKSWPVKTDVYAEISGGYGYQYQQKEGDTKAMGELVFGSVDLAYRGSCSKLHLLQEPPHRVLLSRTAPAPQSHLHRAPAHSQGHSYTAPPPIGESGSQLHRAPPIGESGSQLHRAPAHSDPGIEEGSFTSSISSLGDTSATSASLEVPWGAGGARTLAMGVPGGLGSSLSEGDSGFWGPASPYSSTCGSFLCPPSLPNTPRSTSSSRQGSGSSLKNSGSLNSLQRRFLRSINTSLEALGEAQEEGGVGGASPCPPGHRRATKLGLAVIIELQGQQHYLQEGVEQWLFLHLGVIEGCINKLQAATHTAYLHRHCFVSATHAAVTKLQQDLVDLVSGPRVVCPVWLGLLQPCAAAERRALCTSFVDTLAVVLNTFDTKHTNL